MRGLREAKASEIVEPAFNKPARLLSAVKGLEFVQPQRPDECCGFGGTFSVFEEPVSAKMGERVFLDRRGERAQSLPLRHRLGFGVALLAQVPQALVVEVGVVLGLDELRGRLRMVDPRHARAPLSTCAMWMNFSGRPARRAQPCWCMTHDMSGETMYSAPARW